MGSKTWPLTIKEIWQFFVLFYSFPLILKLFQNIFNIKNIVGDVQNSSPGETPVMGIVWQNCKNTAHVLFSFFSLFLSSPQKLKLRKDLAALTRLEFLKSKHKFATETSPLHV